ncbi:hypothetical protein [Bordetella sp. LUAb4]|uniref:hypothetical protein n=1 Tax=Bordetella sp. LUAb4 TaxID=2843195 RepID=UPI001E4F2BEB|nr:hypothetical protein [Bordetella sp. LUAb4]
MPVSDDMLLAALHGQAAQALPELQPYPAMPQDRSARHRRAASGGADASAGSDAGAASAAIVLTEPAERYTEAPNVHADNDFQVKGMLNRVALGNGANTVTVTGKFANVTAGDGNNRIDGAMKNVTLGHGDNHFTGDAQVMQVGNGDNRISGGFTMLSVGKGNNEITVKERLGTLTLGGGNNMVDTGGLKRGGHVKLNGGVTTLKAPLDDLTVEFGAGATKDNVTIGRMGNDLVASRTDTNEKLIVPGLFSTFPRPTFTLRAGSSRFHV